ncbi:hypothetical protein D3C72_1248260 [compost metagenome]
MHAGHVQVEQDQVEVVVLAGQRQGAVQVGSFHDFAALEAIADNVVDGFAKQGVIVGNQNFVHGLFTSFLLDGAGTRLQAMNSGEGFWLRWLQRQVGLLPGVQAVAVPIQILIAQGFRAFYRVPA